ncbi:MAG: GDSL-type esterase/lipase family protein [Clostridium sp.]|nr:GDSL-type esterase/lipase family protein [Clostridium sp.]MCM1546943.1 GDSL-type esterase/lipase family protein [Ruminococcus sp.]
MLKIRKRLLSAAASAAMALSCIAGTTLGQGVSAAQTDWKFDFGANAQSGYTSVSASQGYNTSNGYGFRNTSGVKDVSAPGSGALSDAVQFTDTENDNNTFDVDLPNGLYRVSVTLGQTNRTSVYMEGMLQIVNMTGNNAVDSILIPVTDGQLNVRAAAGKEGYPFTISALEIKQVSTDPAMPKTVWMCGDSTVCNYYPKDTSVQAGWGQVLDQFIDSSWTIRNMAASGQYAKGFVEAGQFDAIEYYGKAGDIYIISIGINDTNYSNETEYYNTVTDMTKKAKAKGMEVILVKQQGRNGDATRKPLLTGRWFGGALDKIGTEQDVQVIDLFTPWQNHCISIGETATTALYMENDTLHPNRQGALKLAEFAAEQIDWNSEEAVPEGAEIAENTTYRFRNKNSGMYLYAETYTKACNVSQYSTLSLDEQSIWTVKKADDGYYRIYSQIDKGQYLLDLDMGKSDNGTNIGVYEDTKSDAQLFKFVDNKDGSYCITTKNSKDKSCVEVKDALDYNFANIQQWEINGHACQSWILEPVTYTGKGSSITVGDLNNDGVINVIDSVLIKRYAAGKPNGNRHNADTNADGIVDGSDVEAISKYIIKTEKTFEAVEKRSSFYYANEASFSMGVKESENKGFKKDSYVNLDNKVGSYIHWLPYAPEDGNYLCTFSIANASEANRSMKIEVNEGEDYWIQDFLTTGSWTTWNTRGIVLPLKKGINRIRMTSNTEQGGPNIDTLYIEKTEEPVAETYIPNQDPVPDPPSNDPVVYIAGDSTVQTYRASAAPQQGWGAYLNDYLPENYTVSNHAIAGRSSKSFYDNGRLDTILNEMKAGDYLLVQFGINDSAYNNAERYAPVSGTVPGAEGSFEYYISKYIEGAQEKGGNPILVTTVLGLKAYNNSTKKFEGSYQNYCNAMKKLAAHYNIPCIDLNSLMVDHYNSIGYDAAYNYHLISTELSDTDMTHFTETGAKAVAKLVADKLNGLL